MCHKMEEFTRENTYAWTKEEVYELKLRKFAKVNHNVCGIIAISMILVIAFGAYTAYLITHTQAVTTLTALNILYITITLCSSFMGLCAMHQTRIVLISYVWAESIVSSLLAIGQIIMTIGDTSIEGSISCSHPLIKEWMYILCGFYTIFIILKVYMVILLFDLFSTTDKNMRELYMSDFHLTPNFSATNIPL